MKFKLRSTYQPRGDQPTAIDQLVRGIEAGDKHQVLLGVTGSGQNLHHGQSNRSRRPPRA